MNGSAMTAPMKASALINVWQSAVSSSRNVKAPLGSSTPSCPCAPACVALRCTKNVYDGSPFEAGRHCDVISRKRVENSAASVHPVLELNTTRNAFPRGSVAFSARAVWANNNANEPSAALPHLRLRTRGGPPLCEGLPALKVMNRSGSHTKERGPSEAQATVHAEILSFQVVRATSRAKVRAQRGFLPFASVLMRVSPPGKQNAFFLRSPPLPNSALKCAPLPGS